MTQTSTVKNLAIRLSATWPVGELTRQRVAFSRRWVGDDPLSASWPPGPTRRNSSVASFVEHNPGVALPDAPIEPVARYEASGSTEIFTGRAVCRYSRAHFVRPCSYVRTSQDYRGTFARARIRKSVRKGFYTSPVSTAHLRGCLIHTIVNTVRFHGCFVYYIARVSGPSARAM